MELRIGFSRSKKDNPISWIIRKAERVNYSHAYIRFYSKSTSKWVVYHATLKGVCFISWDNFLKYNEIDHEYDTDTLEEQRHQIMGFCIDWAGTQYGIWQLVGMGLVRLYAAISGRDIRNPWSSGKKTQVCSEMISYLLKSLGHDIDIDKAEILGPSWLSAYLSNKYKAEYSIT